MAKCISCSKEFKPKQSNWKLCYECWIKEKPNIIKKLEGVE
jgi:hypothetical protein